jgi:pantothenate kinase type III
MIASPINVSQLVPYADGIKQAGLALQQAVRVLNSVVERLAAVAPDTPELAAARWTYAGLQDGVVNDAVGTIRKTLRTLRTLGASRDSVAAALFGADMASHMNRLGKAFALADEISSTKSALAS